MFVAQRLIVVCSCANIVVGWVIFLLFQVEARTLTTSIVCHKLVDGICC